MATTDDPQPLTVSPTEQLAAALAAAEEENEKALDANPTFRSLLKWFGRDPSSWSARRAVEHALLFCERTPEAAAWAAYITAQDDDQRLTRAFVANWLSGTVEASTSSEEKT